MSNEWDYKIKVFINYILLIIYKVVLHKYTHQSIGSKLPAFPLKTTFSLSAREKSVIMVHICKYSFCLFFQAPIPIIKIWYWAVLRKKGFNEFRTSYIEKNCLLAWAVYLRPSFMCLYMLLRPYFISVNNKGTDQTALRRRLIWAFCCSPVH